MIAESVELFVIKYSVCTREYKLERKVRRFAEYIEIKLPRDGALVHGRFKCQGYYTSKAL